MITDYNHRSNYLTIDLKTIFAQAKPTEMEISKLPYPKTVDATKALMP